MHGMKTATLSPTTEAAIWTRVIHPDGDMSPTTARALLKLEFDEHDRQRMHNLATKAQEGPLTPEVIPLTSSINESIVALARCSPKYRRPARPRIRPTQELS